MTVVLSVRCAEGLVLASDSQATDMSSGNIVFATKQTVQKLFPLGSSIAWGATGSSGLVQRFDHLLKQLDPDDLQKPIEELRAILANEQRKLQAQAISETQPAFGQPPQIGVLFAG